MEEQLINESMSESVEISFEYDISLKTLLEMDNVIKNFKCGLVSSVRGHNNCNPTSWSSEAELIY